MKLNIATKRIGAVFLGLALCASVAAITVQKASANEGNGNSGNSGNIGAKIESRLGNIGKIETRSEAGMQQQIAIGVNGRTLVRGAKVTAVSGSMISADVAWGSYVSSWKVDASKAVFVRHNGGNSIISEVKVGDIISFSGVLDTTASNATVKADVVKDWSIDRTNTPRAGTMQGELKAMGSTTAPTTLTLDVKGKGSSNDDSAVGTFTVNVAANTAILNKDWTTLGLGSFQIGDSVRFYGLINADNSANATVVRNVSR